MKPITPEGWPRGAGYSHAVLAEGRTLFLAGQVGWDPITSRVVDGGFTVQVGRALDNIATLLAAAGAKPEHLVRMTWYVTDLAAYQAERQQIGRIYRDRFDRHFPAMSVVGVAGLLEPGALVEIEATAVLPQ
jgi:enamine deaminase RidA (YjgF/YER057c/UK114 family)